MDVSSTIDKDAGASEISRHRAIFCIRVQNIRNPSKMCAMRLVAGWFFKGVTCIPSKHCAQ